MATAFWRDYRAYRRDAAPPDDAVTAATSGVHHEAQLTKDYHRVEKGLSLRAPSRPFGAAVDARLQLLLAGAATDAAHPPYVGYAQDAREALATWNSGGAVAEGINIPPIPRPEIAPELLEQYFTSRHSVRDFDDERLVDPALVAEAVRLATYTPSVCNRQSGRAHLFQGAEASENVLVHQNGNRGFRAQVRSVIVVTSERRLFAGAEERNQRWIDGGLFAMTLVWALHGLGVASCMLNTAASHERLDALRKAADIPENEDIICMIALGYPSAEGIRVARSPRRPLEQVLRIH